jgi:hypothetical protein
MSREKAKGVWEAYFYSGHAKKDQQSMLNMASGHRWSGKDSNGGAICTKPKVHQPKKGSASTYSFSYKGYEMHRVKVPGYMNSVNIYNACKAKRLEPVCDHRNYADGKCRAFGPWHFSHPHHDRQHGIDVKKVRYAFFYCGKANHQRSLINTGNSHKWTHDRRERDGDTFCTKRDPNWTKKHSNFSHKSFKLHRVSVAGKINSDQYGQHARHTKCDQSVTMPTTLMAAVWLSMVAGICQERTNSRERITHTFTVAVPTITGRCSIWIGGIDGPMVRMLMV